MILSPVIILFLILLISVVSPLCEKFTVPAYPGVANGIRLRNQVYAKVTVKNIFQCAERCLNQRVCKSINYDVSSGKCELNMKAEQDFLSTTHFEQNASFIYSNISTWEEGVQGVCRNHKCKDEEMCNSTFVDGFYTAKCDKADSPVIPGCQVPQQFLREIEDAQFLEVGCFNSPDAIFPNYKSFRTTIDWSNMSKTIFQCAQLVKPLGYSAFAIEFYGECWFGMYENANIIHGYVEGSKCSTSCWNGVGKDNVAFLYKFV